MNFFSINPSPEGEKEGGGGWRERVINGLKVLNALEELAVNYDSKVAEADRLGRENETFQEDVTRKAAELEVREGIERDIMDDIQIAMTELSSVRELAAAHKKRLHETMANMMKELNESGAGNVSDETVRIRKMVIPCA